MIALVVTIIVLLILAAVSITTLTQENGIISKAKEAKDLTIVAQEKEQINIAYNAVIAKKVSQRDQTGVTAEELETELKKQEKNVSVTSDNDLIKITFNNSGNKYTINGTTGEIENNTEGGTPEDPNKPAEVVSELKEGDYINYIDKNNIKRKSIVLYAEQSGYGVQVITVNSVADITLGSNTTWTQCRTDYNNIVTTLNNRANNYLNTTYAIKARSPGTLPDNPTLDTTQMVGSQGYKYMYNYENLFKQGDNNYTVDREKMEALNLFEDSKVEKSWAASRYHGVTSNQAYFSVRTTYGAATFVGIDSSGKATPFQHKNGFTPIFTLKSEAKIVGGTGTSESPYELEV